MPDATDDIQRLRFPRIVIEPILRGLGSAHSRTSLLQQLGTTEKDFEQPTFSINGKQLLNLHHWARQHAPPEFGIRELLRHFSATSAGLAGMAALSARNVRESLMVAVRYLPLLIPVMQAELEEDRRHVRFKLDMTADLGELNRLLLEMVTAAVHIISNDVMAQPVPRTIHFTHGYARSGRAARHARELREVFGHRVVFNSSFNGIEGNAADLTIATRSPNDATFSTVKRILEQEMAAQQPASFADTVRHELTRLSHDGHFVTLETFADRLHLSARSLIRRLAAEQTSFKQLNNEVRFRLATELLGKTRFSIKQVAARSGFDNANSFSRAFKTQYGTTPQAWREQQLKQEN